MVTALNENKKGKLVKKCSNYWENSPFVVSLKEEKLSDDFEKWIMTIKKDSEEREVV